VAFSGVLEFQTVMSFKMCNFYYLDVEREREIKGIIFAVVRTTNSSLWVDMRNLYLDTS
jgi:hypothetical protein